MTESRNISEISAEGAPAPARRSVLRGAAALAGLAAVAPLSVGTAEAAETESVDERGKSKSPQVLGPASAIKVGGCKIYKKQKVVVTQPTKGKYFAFSSTCTHQACELIDCEGGKLNCPCHASTFDMTTGKPDTPPATVPLPKKKVKVVGGKVTLL
ncbi:MAG TPA: Rieske (2Fe-2S) protein [Sporichthyaceae bacterium]|nr:Rieske (2Fe-2S) protein [Sporichthyaceae bacterium]